MSIGNSIMKFRLSPSKRMGLYEEVRVFFEARLDLASSLKSIRDRHAVRKDFRAKIVSEWISELEQGRRLTDALAPWVPSSELVLIEAGERGGALSAGLSEAVVLSTASQRSKAAIIGGVAFPIALVGMLIGVLSMFQVNLERML